MNSIDCRSIAAVACVVASHPLGGQAATAPPVRDTVAAYIIGARETVLIKLVYGHPPRADREVLGGLVPYNAPWNTGFGEPTELVTPRPITIGSALIAAGAYSLWTLPTERGATLIVNRDRSTQYDAAGDVARIPLLTDSLPASVSELVIAIRNDRNGPDTLVAQFDRAQSAARHLDHYTVDTRPGTHRTLLITWGRFRWSVALAMP